jgi:hypothetical protein
MRKLLIVAVVLVCVILAAVASFSYHYWHSKHVIFSTVKDDLAFKVYCQGRSPLIFATYVEVSSLGGTVISLNEVPPSSDDLADCAARFPIADLQPDSTYSCLTISFLENERPPLVMPLPFVEGLDLPLKVRPRLAKRSKCGCDVSGSSSTRN